jgi:LacI family transcriptional regulator
MSAKLRILEENSDDKIRQPPMQAGTGESKPAQPSGSVDRKTHQRPPIPRIIAGTFDLGGGIGTLYTNELIAGLVTEAGKRDRLLMFINLAPSDGREKFFSEMASGNVNGILLVGVTDRGFTEEVLRRWIGPVVLVDHYFDDLPITGVIDDSAGGARNVVEHLLSLGHTRIGYVDISRRELNPWRYEGYSDGLRGAGIEVDPGLVVPAFGSFEAGLAAGDTLLSLKNPPTAIFAFDDTRAFGVWRVAETRGIQVGKDLALVGFGDMAPRAGFSEELTSVRFDPRELGRIAVEKIMDLVFGRSRRGELVKVPTQLMVRKSSAGAVIKR